MSSPYDLFETTREAVDKFMAQDLCEHPSLQNQFQDVTDGVRVTCGECGAYLHHLIGGKVEYRPSQQHCEVQK